MGFTSLFKSGTKAEHPASARLSSAPAPPPLPPAWAWPSCKQPKTLSFRAHADRRSRSSNMDPYTSIVVNSVYSDEEDQELDEMTVGSCSFRIMAEEEEVEEEDVIKGLRSDRLFFDPGGCSILHDHQLASCSSSSTKELHTAHEDKRMSRLADHQQPTSPTAPSPSLSPPPVPPRKSYEKRGRRARPGVVAEERESNDPYRDFRASMGEVATAQGLRDWDALEEMLGWYLGANSKGAHRFILAAFVDLLVAIASSPPPAASGARPMASSSSPSFTTTTTSAAATANNDSDSFDSALLVCSSSCSSCSCSCSSSNSCIKFVVDEEEHEEDGDNCHLYEEKDDRDEDDLTEGTKATVIPDGDAGADRLADD